MGGFFQSAQRTVLTLVECLDISRQMEIYRLATGTFGYDMDVQDVKDSAAVRPILREDGTLVS